ncbi:hypothetical protein, partial [Dyella sp.]|uniref:hypothetical protein n=1 Tax=Dyella sp. TaxID=1869338 RepID=UPI002ED4C7C7
MTEIERKIRQREVGDDYLETLANSLTVDQLRTALALLLGSQAPSVRTRAEAMDAILSSGRLVEDVVPLLQSIEAKSPMRHNVLTRYVQNEPILALKNYGPVGRTDGKVQFRFAWRGVSDDAEIFLFEHSVEVAEWKLVDDETKRLEIKHLRHPVVVRIYPSTGAALFCYPGFTQGAATGAGHKLAYEEVVESLILALATHCEIRVSAFATERAIGILQEGVSPRVRIVRTDIDASSGRVSLASEEKSSVDVLLAEFLAPHLSEKLNVELGKAISKAVREAPTTALVAYWNDERVFTRVRFWPIGAEFLFVWHETPSSYQAIHSIVALIVGLAKEVVETGGRDSLEKIQSLRSGEIVSLASFVGNNGGDRDAAKRTLLEAVRAGFLTPVYRLKKPGLFLDSPNEWQADVTMLRRVFWHEDGTFVDGSRPEEI